MMNKITFIVVLLSSITFGYSQSFSVPDSNFEQALIDLNIDTSSSTNAIDGVVNLSVAVTGTTNLNLANKNISNLTGIEYFTDVEWLFLENNNLTDVDLSSNTSLVGLRISGNNLLNLDVSGLSNLEDLLCGSNNISSLILPVVSSLDLLECQFNQLTNLDLSNSNLLTDLKCQNNDLGSLNLNNCTSLEKVDAFGCNLYEVFLNNCTLLEDIDFRFNSLTTLDLSNNANLNRVNLRVNNLANLNFQNGANTLISSVSGSFNTMSNPYLTCIQVDDADYSTNTWNNRDAQTSFSTNCPTEPEIVNISDANFEQYLIDENIDVDGIINGEILKAYAENVTHLNLPSRNVSSLTGIEAFTALESLRAHDNNLTVVDLSNNIELKTVVLALNQLTSINLSNNAKLEEVILQTNNLTSLNIKNGANTLLNNASDFIIDDNSNLTCVEVDDVSFSNATWSTKDSQTMYSLSCSSSNIVSIPDSNFEQALIDENIDSDGVVNGQVLESDVIGVTYLDVNSKSISDLTGIEAFAALETLFVHNNNLSTINVSQNSELTGLVAALNQLTGIDVSNNTKLVSLSLSDNLITDLEVSNNTGLFQIYINNNLLESLDVSTLLDLEELSVNNNDIDVLQINTNSKLRILDCSFNEITVLNLLSNTDLQSLICNNNSIEYLDLTQNAALTNAILNNNELIGLNIKNGANNNISNSNFTTLANSNLSCVQVDDESYSNTNWTQIDMVTSFNVSCTPVNDDCSYTVPIILAQDTPSNTNSATGSSNNPSCQQSGITILDLWYSFPAPASGSVTMTLNAAPLVGKIALYNSCNDAQPLYCAENELIINGLTPNATYYLQVWLEASTSPSGKSALLNETGAFVLNVQDTSTLSVDSQNEEEIFVNVYPNPAKDVITVKSKNTINAIEIFNISGQKVFSNNKSLNGENKIDLRRFTSGLYLMKIYNETTSVTKKIIIK